MSELARHGGELDRTQQNPLAALPREWRKPVAFFAAFHSDILKGVAGVVTRFRFWMKDDLLTLEEAQAVMRRCMTPEKCASFQYAGQLLAEMASLVEQTVKTRKARETLIREREKASAEQAVADADRGRVLELLAGIGELNGRP